MWIVTIIIPNIIDYCLEDLYLMLTLMVSAEACVQTKVPSMCYSQKLTTWGNFNLFNHYPGSITSYWHQSQLGQCTNVTLDLVLPLIALAGWCVTAQW